jgi:hypothetical protein
MALRYSLFFGKFGRSTTGAPVSIRPSPQAFPRAILRTMPKGPQGQKRPAEAIGNAVHVMRIAMGEVEEKPPERSAAAELEARG